MNSQDSKEGGTNQLPNTPIGDSVAEHIVLLQAAAAALLDRAKSESSTTDGALAIEKAASALKVAGEIGRARSEVAKLNEEIAKLKRENTTTHQRERSERIRDYVALLTPVVTIITLAATLVAQNWQFLKAEQTKREQAVDAQWQDAVKVISASGALSPGVIALQPFLQSGKYKEQAKDVAASLLSNSTDVAFFHSLFGPALGSISWEDAPRVIQIDRAVYARANPLYPKVWNATYERDDTSSLTKDELAAYNYAQAVIPFLSSNIGALLKKTRTSTISLDLSSTYVKDADWQGANLRGATLEGAYFLRVDLRNADLADVARFEGLDFRLTAWWEAKSIDGPFLRYLQERCPFLPNASYGPRGEHQTKEQYAAAMQRLQKAP